MLALLATRGAALHDAGCVPTSADPSTMHTIALPYLGTYYLEERDVPPPFNMPPPVPLTGFLLGNGTWLYEEANGVPGLQRGGSDLVGDCFPPPPLPCIIIDDNPVNDYNCGHGPDDGWLFLWWL